eukprot:CAMPEP_0184696408 /NCGR_PEP_ID=MMETSP0313-20130426/3719_1 /TAXON_ID=2792 /ORGANISM="Porphyridium aerugineum, Strain SAG 1380-2" /LENGTH=824 /DNA_ID=CAMNT_0027155035 /DNA_START=218 /DNA_END=2692 /DNA_ORIENTATION=-
MKAIIIAVLLLILGSIYIYRTLASARATNKTKLSTSSSQSQSKSKQKTSENANANSKKVALGIKAKSSRADRVRKEMLEYAEPQISSSPSSIIRMLILYGTEYGFSKEVARKLAETIQDKLGNSDQNDGMPVVVPRVLSMAHCRLIDLAKESYVFMCCSTTGDGVVPNDAREMQDLLSLGVKEEEEEEEEGNSDTNIEVNEINEGEKSPISGGLEKKHTAEQLHQLMDKNNAHELFKNFGKDTKFGVIALGDRGYPHFCRGGLIFERLLKIHTGQEPIEPAACIDQEDWTSIDAWIDTVLGKIKQDIETNTAALAIDPQVDEDYLLENIKSLDGSRLGMATGSSAAAGMDVIGELHPDAIVYSKERPLAATVVVREPLTKIVEKDDKETIHVEFDIESRNMDYVCGDAVGVVASNCPDIVNDVLIALAANANDTINIRGEEVRVDDALSHYLDLKNLKPEILQYISTLVRSEDDKAKLQELLAGADSHSKSQKVIEYLAPREFSDLLNDFPSAAFPLSGLARNLKPLLPRYYSIASAPRPKNGGLTSQDLPKRLAITVSVLRYESLGKGRKGVATTFLADRVAVASKDHNLQRSLSTHGKTPTVKIFISRNHDFRLPASENVPIIMIGPGTGVAPFRGFLQQRMGEAKLTAHNDDDENEITPTTTTSNVNGVANGGGNGLKANGAYSNGSMINGGSITHDLSRNWLFFGCRHERRDFLYADELKYYVKHGGLELRTAFSRDTADGHKVYVQHRLIEEGKTIWQLVDGQHAHIYVCGDAGKMANDVHNALLQIFQEQGNMKHSEAEKYIHKLEKSHRYQRDVWAS